MLRTKLLLLFILFQYNSCQETQINSEIIEVSKPQPKEPTTDLEGSNTEVPDLPIPLPSLVQERTFRLGFTPWPHSNTEEAIDDVYELIKNHGEIVAHHLDSGVPWTEATAFPNYLNYHISIQSEVNGRVMRTLPFLTTHEVYLGLGPFNKYRTSLAGFWREGEQMELTQPWSGYDIDHIAVLSSYINYSLEMLARFKPKYFNYAIEINEYLGHNPGKIENVKTFAQTIYQTLKPMYPDTIFMVSFVLKDPSHMTMSLSKDLFTQINEYIDMLGLSIYPYAFYSHHQKGNPSNLPTNWLKQVSSMAPGKPLFIAETGWPAEDLIIPSFSLNEQINEAYQKDYLRKLYDDSNDLNVKGLIWFTGYDFDNLWSNALGKDDLSKIWRDTGLLENDGDEREAFRLWKKWHKDVPLVDSLSTYPVPGPIAPIE